MVPSAKLRIIEIIFPFKLLLVRSNKREKATDTIMKMVVVVVNKEFDLKPIQRLKLVNEKARDRRTIKRLTNPKEAIRESNMRPKNVGAKHKEEIFSDAERKNGNEMLVGHLEWSRTVECVFMTSESCGPRTKVALTTTKATKSTKRESDDSRQPETKQTPKTHKSDPDRNSHAAMELCRIVRDSRNSSVKM
jgi:hypothetical protein